MVVKFKKLKKTLKGGSGPPKSKRYQTNSEGNIKYDAYGKPITKARFFSWQGFTNALSTFKKPKLTGVNFQPYSKIRWSQPWFFGRRRGKVKLPPVETNQAQDQQKYNTTESGGPGGAGGPNIPKNLNGSNGGNGGKKNTKDNVGAFIAKLETEGATKPPPGEVLAELKAGQGSGAPPGGSEQEKKKDSATGPPTGPPATPTTGPPATPPTGPPTGPPATPATGSQKGGFRKIITNTSRTTTNKYKKMKITRKQYKNKNKNKNKNSDSK